MHELAEVQLPILQPNPKGPKIEFRAVVDDFWYCSPPNTLVEKGKTQQLRFGVFREGVFQKMPALEGQFLKEISVRFAGENHLRTQKNTKQSSAQRFLNDPFPKTPFFQLLKNKRRNFFDKFQAGLRTYNRCLQNAELSGTESRIAHDSQNRGPGLARNSAARSKKSDSTSTGVWCVPGFGAGFEIALKPSKLQKEGEILARGAFIFCAKLWYAPNPGSKEI